MANPRKRLISTSSCFPRAEIKLTGTLYIYLGNPLDLHWS
uniref:OO_Ba0013J05-OO_Ba0033A15.21 protein n=1 Tax=Oryza officinalis TaxID=4535 RepID=D0ABG4_9ORYZ|nr:OO_Ba0013J05-OO_Ba0033A15.21 [Oryza officinalis]